jgi:hypothetical protein
MIHLTWNDLLQWAGTACLLTMYVLMSFFPHLHPWNIVAGICGGACYLAWCIRVQNKPQMIVNGVALAIGAAGLFKAWV